MRMTIKKCDEFYLYFARSEIYRYFPKQNLQYGKLTILENDEQTVKVLNTELPRLHFLKI